MKMMQLVFFSIMTLSLTACSEDNNTNSSGDHVWKEQTDTIDKAKEAEAAIKNSFEMQKQAIEDQEN